MSKILTIDVTGAERQKISLFDGTKEVHHSWRDKKRPLLVCLDKFLKEKKIKLSVLTGLILLEGGGTFSQVRSAAAVLNAWHHVARLPVLGIDKRKIVSYQKILKVARRAFVRSPRGRLIKPIYTGEPNITVM